MEFQDCGQTTCFSAPHWLNIEPSIWETETKDTTLCSQIRLIVYTRFVVVWLQKCVSVDLTQVLFGKMNRWACSSIYGVTTQKVETLVVLFCHVYLRKPLRMWSRRIILSIYFTWFQRKKINNKEIHSCLSRLWWEVPQNCFPSPNIYIFFWEYESDPCLLEWIFLCNT